MLGAADRCAGAAAWRGGAVQVAYYMGWRVLQTSPLMTDAIPPSRDRTHGAEAY